MDVTIGIKTKFDAAHHLPNYEGKCRNMHGHTWTVTVELTEPVDSNTGMVMDFKDLKEIVNKIITDLDHKVLNGMIMLPTCENLTIYIYNKLKLYASTRRWTVTVQEGDGGWARVTSK